MENKILNIYCRKLEIQNTRTNSVAYSTWVDLYKTREQTL